MRHHMLVHPTEPYGLFEMSPSPFEPAHDPATDSVSAIDNLIWRLDSNEAVVIFQCTPPQARYFGLTGYVVGTGVRGYRGHGRAPCSIGLGPAVLREARPA